MLFKNYRTVIVVGVMIIAALILLSYSLKYDASTNFFKKTVLAAAAPVQQLFNTSIEAVENAWTRYVRLVGLEEENRILKKKTAELQAELVLYKEGYLEAGRLKQLLSLQEAYPFRYTAARIIGKEQAALSKTLWINKGSAHGLKPGMPVIALPGLIGRLTDVSCSSSKVMLLIDENSNVDAAIQRTRVQGILRGAGSRGCVVRYVSKIQDVKEGDVVLTSGMSNIFPKGLLIGKVSRVDHMDAGLFLSIRVIPFADFASLEEVLVLTSQQQTLPDEKKTEK